MSIRSNSQKELWSIFAAAFILNLVRVILYTAGGRWPLLPNASIVLAMASLSIPRVCNVARRAVARPEILAASLFGVVSLSFFASTALLQVDHSALWLGAVCVICAHFASKERITEASPHR